MKGGYLFLAGWVAGAAFAFFVCWADDRASNTPRPRWRLRFVWTERLGLRDRGMVVFTPAWTLAYWTRTSWVPLGMRNRRHWWGAVRVTRRRADRQDRLP